jgi:Tfp pilus assembly protein PilV
MMEVIAGFGFLSVALLGLTSLSLTTIKAANEARNVSAATNLARAKVEELRSLSYSALTSGADVAPLAENGHSGGPSDADYAQQIAVPAGTFTRTWSVASGPTSTTKVLTVTVEWTDAESHQISLTTTIAE